ncbi:MAG: F0F1 ATP synthase subunit gamma, partial [Bradymonadaceae bacterium]
MPRLSEIQDRIQQVEDLRGVVGAMRSISAMRVQQVREAVEGIREYIRVVEEGISDALALIGVEDLTPEALFPEGGERHTIVYCSEHGFSGKFNNRMLDRAQQQAERVPETRIGLVGTRGIRLAEARDLDIAWTSSMASHTETVPEIAHDIEREAFGRFDPETVDRLDVLYAVRRGRGGQFDVEHETLFPPELDRFDKEVPETGPVHYLEARPLFAELITEFVLTELIRVTMESFLAENTSRLRAMQAARDNIDDELDDLTNRERQQRKKEITSELLDVVSGYEALR